ncbi:hypothetical protein NP233_g3157 [Leucocoprinus birnbaumii]|uniref:Uncharacterized protein n=1 Tax=Leucocoprinus birnbaumii TaxID=56174 RepID=A0AAD5VX04_9AGAR|nr:hypothetical protein NP233_g3157 [Leucocoprinus birnbaumii]
MYLGVQVKERRSLHSLQPLLQKMLGLLPKESQKEIMDELFERLREIYWAHGINPESPFRQTPSGELKLPKFRRFHELDLGTDCDEIFCEDPLNFTPRRGRNGWIDAWGLYPADEEDGLRGVDTPRIIGRLRNMQYLYDEKLAMPEFQFVNALV